MTSENNIRETLLAASKTGAFLEAVYASSLVDREERDDLALELAALHNEGLVDVVSAFEKLSNKSSNGPDFFLTRHVFEKALPHINAPVTPVMRCVLQLYRDAGQDMAAGDVLDGFIGYCAKDAARPQEAMREIEANPDELVDMLPATIAAGSAIDNPRYLAEVIRLGQHQNMELRRRAVFSMARVRWPKGATVPDSALAALEQSAAAEEDDQILASIVKSAFALFQRDKAQDARATALIATVLPKGGEYSLHAASALFGFHTSDLPPALLDLLLTHLRHVKPENKGTLDNIDCGIAHLLKENDSEKGLQFLEELLLAHSGKLTLKAFDSAGGKIRQSSALMSKVLTRWLLRGDRALCEAVYEIGGTHHGDDLRIEIDADELNPVNFVRSVFLARKAIGYFFMKPVTAASVVISLMRHAPDDETLEELGKLLLDPLLLNYPGSMREYVQEQAGRESGKVKETIEGSLASIEEYLEVLRGVPRFPALHPSQSQRESYRRYMSDSIAESMRAAEKRSVFFNLFTRSTLLYGRKSIDYIHAGDGPPRRMETPLKSHGVEMEFPRMDNLDPYGVDFMLRRFRGERFRA